jgi:hypothetical protein
MPKETVFVLLSTMVIVIWLLSHPMNHFNDFLKSLPLFAPVSSILDYLFGFKNAFKERSQSILSVVWNFLRTYLPLVILVELTFLAYHIIG